MISEEEKSEKQRKKNTENEIVAFALILCGPTLLVHICIIHFS